MKVEHHHTKFFWLINQSIYLDIFVTCEHKEKKTNLFPMKVEHHHTKLFWLINQSIYLDILVTCEQ